MHARDEIPGLTKRFEYVREKVTADADTGVRDPDVGPSWAVFQLHFDRPALLVNLIALDNRFQITC